MKRTGDIGLVRVVGEGASASGVRRIEALTAEGARQYLAEQDRRLKETAALLKARPEDVIDRVKALMDERKALERQLADAKRQAAMGGGGSDGAASNIKEIAGTKYLALNVSGVEMKDLKSLADEGRAKVGSGVVAVANASVDGKLGIVVAVTKDLTEKFNAVDLVRVASEKSGGKGGGGRPDMAQAGGPDGSKAMDALDAIAAQLSG